MRPVSKHYTNYFILFHNILLKYNKITRNIITLEAHKYFSKLSLSYFLLFNAFHKHFACLTIKYLLLLINHLNIHNYILFIPFKFNLNYLFRIIASDL